MKQFEREPNTIYVLSLSYGKDSLACLGAIEELSLPLDYIIHAEVWATDTIPADLPPMVEFKEKADKIIYDLYGVKVERTCATIQDGDATFEKYFYTKTNTEKYGEHIYGFPKRNGAWCVERLKQNALTETNLKKLTFEKYFYREYKNKDSIYGFPMSVGGGQWCTQLKTRYCDYTPKNAKGFNIVQYLGIASDEPERIARHEKKKNIMLPLVMAGWNEEKCRKWCEERDLLSPIYTTATRGGCWFCHNQGVKQLRLLRKNYPDLWALLMKWDLDSPTNFDAHGYTVHDFDKRFEMEDKGIVKETDIWYWKYLKQPPKKQISLFEK